MICPFCNRDLPEQPELAFCPYCGAKIAQDAYKSCPWEERERLGFVTSLLSTLKESLTKPGEFYRKMPVSGGIGSPLLYAVIWGTIGLMFAFVWQILFGTVIDFMTSQSPEMVSTYGTLILLAIAILTPLLVLIGIFIGSGILHLCLMIVGGNKKGFEATFRVISYAYGASILYAIPFCGSFIGAIWMMVLEIIGLKEAHEISGGKAALAVFLPLIFCCGLAILLLIILIPILIGSLGSIPSPIKDIPI